MNKMEIEQILRDYHWMVREIERIRSTLNTAGERLTAAYGVESSMPKAKGGTSNPVHQEVSRRERQWRRIEKLEEKIRFIQERIELINDERERTVMDCMLDGMSFTAIAYHLRISKGHIYNIKDSVVDRLYETQKSVV